MRLFVAICLPEHVRASLLQAAQQLKAQGRGSFTRWENFHLTLTFIGETQRIEAAKAALSSVQSPPVPLRVGKIGTFGSLYWAGVDPSPALMALQKQVERAFGEAGFSLEKRAYRPHLTLCRRFQPNGTVRLNGVEAALGHPRFTAHSIHLMESCRVDGRLVYRKVEEKRL